MRSGRGEITNIGNLLEKYKNKLFAPQSSVVKEFCDVVKDLYGYELETDHVSYVVHKKTIHVKAPGPLLSELSLHKGEILTHLRGRLGSKSCPVDIR